MLILDKMNLIAYIINSKILVNLTVFTFNSSYGSYNICLLMNIFVNALIIKYILNGYSERVLPLLNTKNQHNNS